MNINEQNSKNGENKNINENEENQKEEKNVNNFIPQNLKCKSNQYAKYRRWE